MYRHSAVSKSLSNLFGHPAQYSSINNENKSESDLTLSKHPYQAPSKNLVEQVNGTGFLKRKLSFHLSSGDSMLKEVVKSKEEKDAEYLNDLYASFGDNGTEIQAMLFNLNTNSEPTTAELFLRQNESSSSFGSVDEEAETEGDILSADKIVLSQIPDLSQKSKPSSPLRIRDRISNIFNRSRGPSPEPSERTLNTSMIIADEVDEPSLEIGLPPMQPPNIVKKKSSLKFSQSFNNYQNMEFAILESNPNLKGIQLFNIKDVSVANKPTTLSSFNYKLSFTWSGWKQGSYGLDTFQTIETKGDANHFIFTSRNELFEDMSEIHIMRKDFVPQRLSKQLKLASQLELRVPFKDERKFTVWNFMVHIVLSDFLYKSDNIHEPIVGVSWHGTKEGGVVSLWLTRYHCDKGERELLEISRICHFIKDCLPEAVNSVMDAENLIYCVNETNEHLGVQFVTEC